MERIRAVDQGHANTPRCFEKVDARSIEDPDGVFFRPRGDSDAERVTWIVGERKPVSL
jgi:hypothetical protein